MSAQEQSLLGRRGMPLAAASTAAAPLRLRRHAQWEPRPRALDVQHAPAVLPALDDAPGFDDFDRDGDATHSARERHREDEGTLPRPSQARLPAQAAAALPMPPPVPRDAVTPVQSAPPPLPRDETTALPVSPVIRPVIWPTALVTPAAPAVQRLVKTETVTRTVEKLVPSETAPAAASTTRPATAPSEVRTERHPFGMTIAHPATSTLTAASAEPAPQTAAALVQRIDRLVLAPAAAPPSLSAEPPDAAPPSGAAATTVLPTAAPRRAFGRATADPLPAANPKTVSLDLLRGAAEASTLSIGSLHVVVKPPALPLVPGAAPAVVQPGHPQPPTAAAARPVRSAYRNPWFAGRRVE